MSLTFQQLREANADRCEEVYHPVEEWSPTDWACAMGGECGEALNLVKKLRRHFPDFRLTIPVTASERVLVNALRRDIGREVADTVIYADLLCQRLGISLEDAIREKFNRTSEGAGSSVVLGD